MRESEPAKSPHASVGRPFTVVPGDIVLELGLDEGDFPHSLLVLDQTSGPALSVVHAAPEQSPNPAGVVAVRLESGVQRGAAFYRLKGRPSAAAMAAQLARYWAPATPTTPYSRSKLEDQGKTGKGEPVFIGRYWATWNNRTPAPPVGEPGFGVDALYRAVKWAARADAAPFSANQGTTCAAFVTACYQAALLKQAAIEAASSGSHATLQSRLMELADALKAQRGPKKNTWEQMKQMDEKAAFRPTRSGRPISNRAERELSNRGSSLTREEAWLLVTKSLGLGSKTLEDVFTVGLLVDAKYNYTTNIHAMLERDSQNWALLGRER